MREISDTLQCWLDAGEEVAMATVIRVDGSAPRSEGAKMLVTRSGKIFGSVSGGCVEAAVAEEAQGVLETGKPRIVRYGINRNMMWDVGLACGGAIDVYIEALQRDRVPTMEPGRVACTIVGGPDRVGQRVAFSGRGEGDGLQTAGVGEFGGLQAAGDGAGSRALPPALEGGMREAAREALASGAARTVAIGEYEVFIDPQPPPARLVIVGAVHIAVALCAMATRAGFSVTIVDPRERLNNRDRFPDAAALAVGWPEDELPKLGIDEATYVAVLTHDEKFDDPTLDHVLRRNPRYVGAIGSKKTQALRRERLQQAGIPIEAIDRLHAPIGLDIGAELPEEIAVAILAEMIAQKYGHGGAPLKDRAEPHIHSAP